MTEEIKPEPDNNPSGISRRPVYRWAIYSYWAFASVVLMKILGASVGFWDFPATWLYFAAFGPAVIFFFYALLEDVIVDAVYEGTSRALVELIEHMDDELPTEEEEERIAALYNSEPAGRA